VDRLLLDGYEVIGLDNLSTGKVKFLERAFDNTNFSFQELDLFSENNLSDFFDGVSSVFHLAANADVRYGPQNPSKDFEQNTFVTHKVLEASRRARATNFYFASTGSIYGESQTVPTPEDAPFPIQTSLYGASKLAGEGLVTAYAEAFGMKTCIFRFVSILGPRYTHGHVFDFWKQLKEDPGELDVLGNGYQKKSYLHVYDCIEAIMIALKATKEKVSIFNLGVDDYCEVRDSIKWITHEMGLMPKVSFGSEPKGWIGDNPLILLDTNRIRNLGWVPTRSIESSVRETVNFLESSRDWLP
jgi:UDP-glucose 4-epimerase